MSNLGGSCHRRIPVVASKESRAKFLPLPAASGNAGATKRRSGGRAGEGRPSDPG